MKYQSKSYTGFAFLLSITMALGPLALDTYLPAFPAIAENLGTNVHEISFSVSIYVFFLAFGQLIAGPLSDRFGRQTIMLSGLVCFSLSSLLISQANTFTWLLCFRALQAFGAGWTMVCIPALVRDKLSGKEAAKFYSLIGLIMMVAPAVAPSFGSMLLHYFGWPSIFVFLAGYSILLVAILKISIFREKIDRGTKPQSLSFLKGYSTVLKTPYALMYMLLQAMAFSVMLVFISHASFIYQEHFDVGPQQFSLLFGANIIAMFCANIINRRLLNIFEPKTIFKFALTLQMLGIISMLIVTKLDLAIAYFVFPLVLTIGLMGAISPNINATFMDLFPTNSGTAAALFGATQFSVAGIMSGLSSLLPETVFYIILFQLFCSLVCVSLVWASRNKFAE